MLKMRIFLEKTEKKNRKCILFRSKNNQVL